MDTGQYNFENVSASDFLKHIIATRSISISDQSIHPPHTRRDGDTDNLMGHPISANFVEEFYRPLKFGANSGLQIMYLGLVTLLIVAITA